MDIRSIMTADPISVEPDTTLEEIATLMKDENIGSVPVVEDEELCGIVTDRDIVVRCIAAGKDAAECTAEEIMSTDVQSLSPEMSVDDAARLMSDKQIRRLPVVEGQRLVGVVSLGDLAVKSHDDDLSGDTLEDVSKGVRQSKAREGISARRAQSSRPKTSTSLRPPLPSEAAAQAGTLKGEIENLARGQKGADRSGRRAGKQQSSKHEPAVPAKQQTQNLKSDSSSRKQGIASHSAKEENARNDKVIPFRAENEMRNTRVLKPGKGRQTAS